MGIREVNRLTNKLNTLKRKMKFKGSLKDFYEHYKLPFRNEEQVVSQSKKMQKKYIIKSINNILM